MVETLKVHFKANFKPESNDWTLDMNGAIFHVPVGTFTNLVAKMGKHGAAGLFGGAFHFAFTQTDGTSAELHFSNAVGA